MSAIHQRSKSHSAKLLTKMSEMRDSQTLTDVSLKVDEKIFHAHRVVLAASSDYFCAMFTAGMRESSDDVIELKDSSVTPESLEIILDLVYKSELNVTVENVLDALVSADHLQMTDVIEQCSEFVIKEVVPNQLNKFDIHSLQKVLNIAERHSLFDLQNEVYNRMAVVFKEFSETQEFLELDSVGQLSNLLQRNNLTAPSENFVFKSVVKWINHNKDERLGHAATLFGAVRLGLVDISVLISELRREELKEDQECGKILLEASLYNNVPALLPGLTSIKTEPRARSSVLIAFEKKTSLKFYDMRRKIWQNVGKHTPITVKCCAVTSFGNFVYVGLGENCSACTVYRYSIDSNTWDELPSMRNQAYNRQFQLIVLGEYLYAIGRNPERYSFREKRWQDITSIPVSDNWKVAELDGCIYAVGCSATWSFDESKNEWIQKASKLSNQQPGFAFGYKGQLITTGGKRDKTVEAYCKESDRWSIVKQKHSFYSPFSELAFEFDNRIFIKLNNFVFDCGVNVSSSDRVYPVNLDEWKNVNKMNDEALVAYAPLNIRKMLEDK